MTVPAHPDDTAAAPVAIQVELEGGPASLPPELRRQRISPDAPKVKIPFNGGYEHFERTDDENREPVVFRWSYRSRIAE
ncbi:DUF5988 family protein [Micromonospora sp. NPDC000207]|uniref:DUF5988 family protein n=1 Tax=Micromonospora sp. NPDC000207 TaxID=3154246 RepID=UPI003319E28C